MHSAEGLGNQQARSLGQMTTSALQHGRGLGSTPLCLGEKKSNYISFQGSLGP